VQFIPSSLSGAWLIEPEFRRDDRGGFARSWCSREFEQHGLDSRLVQCNISTNGIQGTVRGMHFQRDPYAETKLVRCTRGAILDVIVDLRRESSTCGQWVSFELSADNHRMLYIPAGLAHGFQTLMDDTEVFYQMSNEFQAGHSSGVHWNDPSIQVKWPLPISRISIQDETWPAWK
jgi:dTDP-4-dehydrorhamnose 3,5-epimerase